MAMSRQQKKAYGKMKDEESRARWFDNLAKGIEGDALPWRKPWKVRWGSSSSLTRDVNSAVRLPGSTGEPLAWVKT